VSWCVSGVKRSKALRLTPTTKRLNGFFLQHRFFIPPQPTLIILLLTHRTHCAVLKVPSKINLELYKDDIISWVSEKHTIPGILSRIIGIRILLNPSDQKAQCLILKHVA
jgi:hypothetical protein